MRTSRGGGQSLPPYSFPHSGPCLVAGNARCLPDDLKRAQEIFPDAPIIAVNGASREVLAFALYSRHPERFVARGFEWIKWQFKLHDEFTVHGCNKEKSGDLPYVDYWWIDSGGGGGSAWGARKLGWLMGFDLVILCGCPLEPGPYVGGHGLGGVMTRQEICATMFQEIQEDAGWHEGVSSMSGRTAELLGTPD